MYLRDIFLFVVLGGATVQANSIKAITTGLNAIGSALDEITKSIRTTDADNFEDRFQVLTKGAKKLEESIIDSTKAIKSNKDNVGPFALSRMAFNSMGFRSKTKALVEALISKKPLFVERKKVKIVYDQLLGQKQALDKFSDSVLSVTPRLVLPTVTGKSVEMASYLQEGLNAFADPQLKTNAKEITTDMSRVKR